MSPTLKIEIIKGFADFCTSGGKTVFLQNKAENKPLVQLKRMRDEQF